MSYNDTLKSHNTRLQAILDGIEAIPNTQEKTVDITENRTVEILPDEGYLLSKVTANVNVASSGGGGESGEKSKLAQLVDKSITEVTYEDLRGATIIEVYSFYNTSKLQSVCIPETVTSIEYNAFFKCSGLKRLEIRRATPPTLNATAFGNMGSTVATLRFEVPAASVEAYKAATNWSAYADQIFAIEE